MSYVVCYACVVHMCLLAGKICCFVDIWFLMDVRDVGQLAPVAVNCTDNQRVPTCQCMNVIPPRDDRCRGPKA